MEHFLATCRAFWAAVVMSLCVAWPSLAQAPLDEAKTLNDQAVDLYRAGKAGEAIPLAKHALEMRERALPSGHPDIAQSLNNLAFLYPAQGRLAEAELLYARALEMLEKALPSVHPDIALGLNNLAALYDTQGRLAEAEPLYKRALEMLEKALPSGHPDIALGLNNLASLYFARRDWDTSYALLTRGTDILVQRSRRGSEGLGETLILLCHENHEVIMSRFRRQHGHRGRRLASATAIMVRSVDIEFGV